MTRVLTWVVSILMVLSSGWGLYQTTRLSKASEALQDARSRADLYEGSYQASKRTVEALRASAQIRQQALEKRAEEAEEARRKADAKNQELAQALQEHRAWSDTPLPESVRNGLIDSLRE